MIDEDGNLLGMMSPKEGMQVAQERGLDLVEIVPNANPPVCKIIDFGKYKYDVSKKERMQRKRQHLSQLKEIRFHPRTDVHDFEFKVRHARHFIEGGHKVKATVIFRGREMTYKEQGEKLLSRLVERLGEIAKVDQPAHMEGRYMIMFFVPDRAKKKVTPKSQKGVPSKGKVEKE